MITLENIRLNKINIMMQKPLTNTSETCCVGDKEHAIKNDRLNRKAIFREFVEGYDCKELSRRLLKKNPYRPTFLDSDHLDRFYEFFEEKILIVEPNRRNLVAAVFLLSAYENVWKQARRFLCKRGIDFSKVRLRNLNTEEYTLFKAAKEVYGGSKVQIEIDEYCDEELIPLPVLNLIMTGYIIDYFGFDYVLPYTEAKN